MEQTAIINLITNINKQLEAKFMKTGYEDDIVISDNNTFIILDWDDTLFPTTWANRKMMRIVDNNERYKYADIFKPLDNVLVKLLNLLTRYGKVCIITNATRRWVEISSLVLPQTNTILNNIDVFSAKEEYIDRTTDHMKWKIFKFHDLIKEDCNHHKLLNIVSIGDALNEYYALSNLSEHFNDKIKFLKTIKLNKQPKLGELIEELNALCKILPNIISERKQISKVVKYS